MHLILAPKGAIFIYSRRRNLSAIYRQEHQQRGVMWLIGLFRKIFGEDEPERPKPKKNIWVSVELFCAIVLEDPPKELRSSVGVWQMDSRFRMWYYDFDDQVTLVTEEIEVFGVTGSSVLGVLSYEYGYTERGVLGDDREVYRLKEDSGQE